MFTKAVLILLLFFMFSDLTEAGPLAMRCLKLKDFGSSIDLSLMPDPNNVMFSGSNNSDSFECEEMRTGRPWKYQVIYRHVIFSMANH